MSGRAKGRRKGLLIALEGIDCAGTTTQAALLTKWLRSRGITAHRTAEPSGGPIGRHIRNLLRSGKATPEELALLFAADRLDHLEREINPPLARGDWIISDRYRLSSLAYQSIECDPEWVALINRYAPPANLTILIDIPVRVAMKRLESRGNERERFESARFLNKVRKMYLDCAKRKEEGPIITLDGAPPPQDVSRNIINAMRSNRRISLALHSSIARAAS